MGIKEKLGKIKKLDPKIWIASYVVISALLLYFYPSMQVSHFEIDNATTIATLENQYRTTLAQILGGGAVAIGIYFGWKNYLTAQENLKTAQEGQITERFTRAIDQLGAKDKNGNPDIEIRLGGIYSLERIADESEKDYWPIMKILTAYVRKNSSIKDQKVKERDEVLEDIQAILTLIGKRRHYNGTETSRLDLQRTYLKRTYLQDAHLEGAWLDEADLKRANLKGAFFQDAYLQKTDLMLADLRGSHFEGAFPIETIFVNAYLQGAHFETAHLEGVHFERSYLQGAKFENALIKEAKFENANLEGAHFDKAKLIKVDFRGAKNLTINQLSKVRTLYNAILDPELEEELRRIGYSHLIDDEPER